MKTSNTLVGTIILLCLTAPAAATPTEMYITPYLADTNEPIALADPNLPYVYPEMMAGTQLTLVISSNIPRERWGGMGIFILESSWEQGQLFGRDYNEITTFYDGSALPAAGPNPLVGDNYVQIRNEWAFGLEFSIFKPGADVGDWFVVDFNSYEPGECVLYFMEQDQEDEREPAFSMNLPLVPTRDFNLDHGVDFGDFIMMAQTWYEVMESEPNRVPGDFDDSLRVDWRDMQAFCQFWLARTRGQIDEN